MRDKRNKAWKEFEKSGSVKDYLEYKGMSVDLPEMRFDVEAGIFDEFDSFQDIETDENNNAFTDFTEFDYDECK